MIIGELIDHWRWRSDQENPIFPYYYPNSCWLTYEVSRKASKRVWTDIYICCLIIYENRGEFGDRDFVLQISKNDSGEIRQGAKRLADNVDVGGRNLMASYFHTRRASYVTNAIILTHSPNSFRDSLHSLHNNMADTNAKYPKNTPTWHCRQERLISLKKGYVASFITPAPNINLLPSPPPTSHLPLHTPHPHPPSLTPRTSYSRTWSPF